jgi:HSP20 family molecular chaperone IbpA
VRQIRPPGNERNGAALVPATELFFPTLRRRRRLLGGPLSEGFPLGRAKRREKIDKESVKMPEYRMKVSPDTVAYGDAENRKLVVEFAIPGAPADTVDVKILRDSVHLAAPARDVEYVASLALAWPVKPEKAEATYEHGLLRIEVPFKDPMEDAVKVAIKAGGAEAKTKSIKA